MKSKDKPKPMRFNTREFLEELLRIVNAEYVEEMERQLALEEYILDQAQYAKDCKVID